MYYAVNENGHRITATPQAKANCPLCKATMIAKCGGIVSWHWAHIADECDVWSEPESEWHLGWKELVRPENCEVVIGQHRADIVGNNGIVIELQHSSISAEEIAQREQFYDNMLWIIDAGEFAHWLEFCNKGAYLTFRWKHPHKSWWANKKAIYFDLGGDDLFLVKQMYSQIPCYGWGYLMSKDLFINRTLSDVIQLASA